MDSRSFADSVGQLHPGGPLPPSVLSAGISKDFMALANLFGLGLPFQSPWTGDEDSMVVDASLGATSGPSIVSGGLLTMFFDGAVRKHYDDFVRRGERAHIESHYGKAHVALWEQHRYRQVRQRRPADRGSPASPHVP